MIADKMIYVWTDATAHVKTELHITLSVAWAHSYNGKWVLGSTHAEDQEPNLTTLS